MPFLLLRLPQSYPQHKTKQWEFANANQIRKYFWSILSIFKDVLAMPYHLKLGLNFNYIKIMSEIVAEKKTEIVTTSSL